MAGLFTHIWIAQLVLRKLRKRDFISKYENIDDYFFGAIAPDIRYVNSSSRDITHKPYGKNSIFEALKVSSVSMPFMAGCETHLIVDATWANDNGLLGESIYRHYSLNANVAVQKFSLYLLVDDYFQGEADWFFQFSAAGNILRANDIRILQNLGFSLKDIALYKSLSAAYLREPGIDTLTDFDIISDNLDESLIRAIIDRMPDFSSFLKEFKKISIDECLTSVEKYL